MIWTFFCISKLLRLLSNIILHVFMSSTVNPSVSLVVANCAEQLHSRCRHPNVRIHWWQLVRRKRGQQFQWMESRLGSLVASMFCRKNTHVSAFIKTFNRHGGTYFSVRQTTNLNQFVTYCLGIERYICQRTLQKQRLQHLCPRVFLSHVCNGFCS